MNVLTIDLNKPSTTYLMTNLSVCPMLCVTSLKEHLPNGFAILFHLKL